MKLQGKVAIVTGASSGIGEATAIALAEQEAIVILTARRLDRIQNVMNQINAAGGKAVAIQTDITKKEQVQKMVDQVKAEFGRVDMLINNAGVMLLSFLDKGKVDEWDQMIDVNIKGVLYGIHAVLPIFKGQGSGHIINVSSDAGHGVFPSSSVYSGTKHAVRAISEGLRIELRGIPEIRVTIISPGAVATELTNHITDQDVTNMFSQQRLVPLESKDIANAIIYAVTQPDHVDINEILVRPATQR